MRNVFDWFVNLIGLLTNYISLAKGAPQVSLTAPNQDHFAPVSLTLI